MNEEIILNVESYNPYVIGAVAYVEQLENGAKITIVDKNGTTTATVEDGKDGKSISSIVLNDNYTLTINYEDGSSTTTGSIRGATGASGVFYGEEEPIDPAINVWVDPADGDGSVLKIRDEDDQWATIESIVGEPAGFGTVTATVDANHGTPAVTVTTSGDDTAKNFAFAFSNLQPAPYDDSELQADLAVLQGQFDTAVAAVTTDTEVTDIRVGADGITDTTAGASVRRQFTDLKSDLFHIADDIYKTDSEEWCKGTQKEQYTSSTFSGFATSWVISKDVFLESIAFKVKSRASSNISEIRIRIESGSFALEKSISVDIGSTMTDVIVPINNVIPSGTVWIGIAANQIATFIHTDDGVNRYAYKYWVNGDLTGLSSLKESGGSTLQLYILATYYDAIAFADGTVTIPMTDFITEEKSNNLLNRNTVKNGYWYATAPGQPTKVEISTNQYVANYQAVPIPVESLEKITITSNGLSAQYYAWFATATLPKEGETADIIDKSASGLANFPLTITIPNGAKYILLSTFKIAESDWIMANEGDTALPYEEYYEKYYINGHEALLKTDEEKNTPLLEVPTNYNLVVGDTFQLFYKGITNAIHAEQLEVVADCSKGNAYERLFEITPATAETLSLSLSLYDNSHNLLDQKTISLIINSKASSPALQKNILCVGDSLTEGGVWVKELHRRLTGSGGTPSGDSLTNINFIGTRENGGVHYEGYGGWTFAKYNAESIDQNSKDITCTHDKDSSDQHSIYEASNGSKWKLETIGNGSIKIMLVSGNSSTFPSSGTLAWVSGGVNHNDIVYTASANASGNPFWNSNTNAVDFANYATEQGVSSIDYVYVLLGWNNASASEESYKESAQTFIDNIQSDFPNAKIVLIGLEIPARDGLATNYGATGAYSKYWSLMQYVFNLDNWYEDLVDANSNVYHINLSGQFDTEYNMPTMSVAVNTRNSTMVNRQSNGVHPAISGQYQIADAVYRDITARL